MPFVGSDPVALKQISDTRWKLTESLTYQGKKEEFIVPVDFTTDLASVPRPLVWLVPRYGRYTRSAILHDHLLTLPDLQKHDADGIFRRSMRELKVPCLQRWMMWGAVGLNSTIKNRGGPLTPKGVLHALGLLAVVIPSALFVLIPFLLVSAWLVLMALLEVIAFPFAWVANRLKPPEERASEVNKPKLLWKM